MLGKIKISLKNFIYWFRYILEDRDWDYVFLYIILKAKLEKMEHYLRDSLEENQLRELRKCIKLLDILIKEDSLESDFEDYGLIFPSMSEKTNDSIFSQIIQEQVERRNELIKILFNKIANNIQYWWD